jgi:hypothetical protein
MGKNNNTMLILGGLAVAGAVGLYMTQKCGILYPIFKSQCNAGEARAQGMSPEQITDQWRAKNYPKQFGGA